ncbi:hypothetical protein BDV40DRAFT_305744 [Aspergillus tamarii]|uniref:Uncharacterized protein n=1 Tax=Aspergillus tamarii TaxID=41984 RepID=A0A5N6UDU6_ASPTM|nr:hypothetical protein BDV40DRAFT_305744 [Aspergillus tamarii]
MISLRTNLGPLTTTFTSPESCTVAVRACPTCTEGWQAQTCSNNAFNHQGVQDDVECWPPRANPSLTTGVALNGWGFYSPGIHCPAGMVTACSVTGRSNEGFQFQYSLNDGETAVGCCPSGYSCGYAGHDQFQTCQSVYVTGSFPVVQCKFGSSNGYTYQTVPATVTATTSNSVTQTHTISAYTVRAPMIQINHMATDLPTSTSPLPTSSDSSSGIKVSASISAHLSPGAKAGIIVAACLGAIGLFALIAWLWYRCGSRKDKAAAAKSEIGDSQVPPIPVTNTGMSQKPQTDRPKSELPAHHNVSELDGSQISEHGNTAGPG